MAESNATNSDRLDEASESIAEFFDRQLVATTELETEARAHGYGEIPAVRIGRMSTGLECIKSLSMLRRRFDIERHAADEGNQGCALISPKQGEALLESIELIASLMRSDLHDVLRHGRDGVAR